MIVRSIQQKPLEKIEIDYILLDINEKEQFNICIVQIDYSNKKEFPYNLENKELVKRKILKALKIANKYEIDIICFPELSFDKEFLNEIKNFEDILIIGGSYYDEYRYNTCPIIYKGNVYSIQKINPNPHFETEVIIGEKMNPGSKITIFHTKNNKFRFVVLICLDYLNEFHRFHKGENKVNIIFSPCFNPEMRKFLQFGNALCNSFHVDSGFSNIIEQENKYGGSCFLCFEHINVLSSLKGCKRDDEFEYKIFEAKGENLLLFKLHLKKVELSTPPDSTPRIQLIARYIFKRKKWKNGSIKVF